MSQENTPTRQSTVQSYSERGSKAYEDPMNKEFLYGEITRRFLHQVEFQPNDKVILDIGCGTGFVFDELGDQFLSRDMRGIGVEPAAGMLEIARRKYGGDGPFTVHEGSFENIPLENRSVDKIISTLALHWVKSLEAAAREMRRVLKNTGSLDIFMIAKDDGAQFKKAIVAAQRKHLTFAQIMTTATLVQRVTPKECHAAFHPFHDDFDLRVEMFTDVVYGTFDDHMKWWKARSTPVIAEIKDKDRFMVDLREELEKTGTDKGIPFDTAYLWITGRSKTNA
ncbi:MAG: class I SAM-dependent methyltransferase [Rhodospirillales bacterium]|jgi:ubiquinone/menaquinone biosynthesis C-methylase UbiE|nr:class I SAM-dependent methyltransferase [Rhodospirillales bacterium]MDP6882964.1 class I SAM-dependent methyltransferase [Rhodospirillales bacterium]